MVLHGIALHLMILHSLACHCIVSYGGAGYCIVGFGARAVSRKTPTYFILGIFLGSNLAPFLNVWCNKSAQRKSAFISCWQTGRSGRRDLTRGEFSLQFLVELMVQIWE